MGRVRTSGFQGLVSPVNEILVPCNNLKITGLPHTPKGVEECDPKAAQQYPISCEWLL